MEVTGALAGLRVIELGGFTSAFTGRLLAEAGADVIRIVPPTGDMLAAEPPYLAASGRSIQEAWYNANKRIIRLALDARAGRESFGSLISGADLLVEDWAPRAELASIDELRTLRPNLVHVSVTPFGRTGPRAHWRANDLVANAMSGSASVTGDEKSGPISGYGNQAHHTAGFYAAICALASLRAARETGLYQHVDLSEHEALVTCTEQVLMQWFFPDWTWKTGIARRQGSLHWSKAYEVYPGSDGKGVMVTGALRFPQILLPWLRDEGSAQELDNAERFPDIRSMLLDIPYLMAVLRDWVSLFPAERTFEEGQKRHQPFGAVWSVGEVLSRSPQIHARKYVQPVEVTGLGKVKFPGRFFRTNVDGPHPTPSHEASEIDWLPRSNPPSGGAASSARPLKGIRVLDFTHVLAGPFGTRILGDLGADILKVGTASRATLTNSPEHPYYTMWNRNKRSISLNMGSEEGRRIARQLAATCDVIIENFSAGVLQRWGLDRDGLKDDNPGVTVISMGGMGQDGPWRDFVTYAPTIHALTGLTYLTNPPGENLMGYGFSLTDHLSGLAGAVAALEGIHHRDRTGEGLSVDLSQFELGLGLLGPAIVDSLVNGVDAEPVGNRHPYASWAPHGIYPAAGDDQGVAIAVKGEDEWARFARIDGPGLADDERFTTHSLRVENQDALDDAIRGWTKTIDPFLISEICQAAGICAGPVQDAEDLALRDPQLESRGFFGTTRSDNWGDYQIDQFPALINGKRPDVYEGVRGLGSDTFDVLAEVLGLADSEVAELMAGGALT